MLPDRKIMVAIIDLKISCRALEKAMEIYGQSEERAHKKVLELLHATHDRLIKKIETAEEVDRRHCNRYAPAIAVKR